MFFNTQATPVETFATQISDSTDRVITSAQEAANEAIDSLAESVLKMRHQAEPLVNQVTHATDQVSALAQQGLDSIRSKARHASDTTVNYIKHEPVKSMLLAASIGVVLMGLLSLTTQSGHRN